MELLLIVLLCIIVGYLLVDKYYNKKKLNNLTKGLEKLEKEKNELTLLNNSLSHDKIKLDGVVNKSVLENLFLKSQLVKISKLMLGINLPRSGKTSDPLSFFNEQELENVENNKNEITYNIDDILIEIGKVGINNISKDKLDFLKKK